MKSALKSEIEKAIQKGYTTFLSGMALGFDTICAETVLDLKKKYGNVKLIAALPCKTQDMKWSDKDRKRYKKLLKKSDGIRCIYDEYAGEECMIERNRYMVNNSSLIIALYNGISGGTKSTIEYAMNRGLDIILIEP